MKVIEIVSKMHRRHHDKARSIKRDKKLQKEIKWCLETFLGLFSDKTEEDFEEFMSLSRANLVRRC